MGPDLGTPEGVRALAAAEELAGGDPLAAAAGLRARGFAPDLAAAALTQAELRRRAVAKFGPSAAVMLFTRSGLEQATRAAVARRRAGRLVAAGVRRLADLGCGLGADAIAAARAGIRVYAVESDPVTAGLAAANAAALGLADRIEVVCADATAVELPEVDAVFCDPARRRRAGQGRAGPDGADRAGGGSRRAGAGPAAGWPGAAGERRVFDPAAFSPPWEFVAGLVARFPRTVLKLAPGIDHALIPPGAEAEWVSVDHDVVEAAFWCGPFAEVSRRATLLTGGRTRAGADDQLAVGHPGRPDAPAAVAPAELTGSGTRRAPVGEVRRFLYDPDGAVVRAHLVAEFAETLDGVLADPSIAYVYADAAEPTPFARCFEVTDVLPFSLKRLRAVLRERSVGRLEILKRGSALDPDALRRDLRLAGTESASLVLTLVAGRHTALLCQPAYAGATKAGGAR